MRQNLFDDEEDSFYGKRYKVKDGPHRLTFREDELTLGNYLHKLREIITEESFERLIKTFDFRKTDFGRFRSAEDLNVYFIKKNNTVFLISSGEFQPSRFMVFYEGAWPLKRADYIT